MLTKRRALWIRNGLRQRERRWNIDNGYINPEDPRPLYKQVGGLCMTVSEYIAVHFRGCKEQGGCYIAPNGTHIAHFWVEHNGWIIDPTVDQFRRWGEKTDGVRVTTRNDPRYDPHCTCDTTH